MSKTINRTESAAEQWLDQLDPSTTVARDARHFRRIIAANAALTEAQTELDEAVAAARAAGDSWFTIGAALGVSRQAAQQRFGSPDAAANPAHAVNVLPTEKGDWEVTKGAGPAPERLLIKAATKSDAVSAARHIVRDSGGGDLVVHNRDGKVRVFQIKSGVRPRRRPTSS